MSTEEGLGDVAAAGGRDWARLQPRTLLRTPRWEALDPQPVCVCVLGG